MRTFDQKTYQLAAEFLKDEPELSGEYFRARLAELLQHTIEGWIEDQKEKLKNDHGRPVPYHGSGPDNQ